MSDSTENDKKKDKRGILRLDISKPRNSSGSVEFRNQPELISQVRIICIWMSIEQPKEIRNQRKRMWRGWGENSVRFLREWFLWNMCNNCSEWVRWAVSSEFGRDFFFVFSGVMCSWPLVAGVILLYSAKGKPRILGIQRIVSFVPEEHLNVMLSLSLQIFNNKINGTPWCLVAAV